jgi:uncharacterized protein (TIGR02453 family)
MKPTFSGLPKELLEFLQALAENNNRAWFNENKERYYSTVVDPVCDFIDAFAPRLEKISTQFIADSRPHGGSMFRIYRDTRFSKDKRPYKENVGCQFRHSAGRDVHAPGFYVHLSPREVFFGAGMWLPPTAVLNRIRQQIVDRPGNWKSITANKKLRTVFGEVSGDRLKRPPQGFPADHPYIEDLKLKSYVVMRYVEPELITTPEFIGEVERSFITASPLMKFLSSAVELPY